jgi:hypothetical protein
MGTLWLLVPGALFALVGVVFAGFAFRTHRWLLLASLSGAIGAFLLVTGWLLTGAGASKVDALKTGGLAGGAIMALYGLWINDRRRTTEEARHELDRARAEQDRLRVSDERFAKSVELLGHQADQVRVGAMHALAGLARARPEYTQTVLDVLCAYLRRPFTHPRYEQRPADPDRARIEPSRTWPSDRIEAADQEIQVRRTALRVIRQLLPAASEDTAPAYDLDLTSASLEYLDLSDRLIGTLVIRGAQLYGITTRLSGVRLSGPALFSRATVHGRIEWDGARLEGGLSLEGAELTGTVQTAGMTVGRFADLRTRRPVDQAGELIVQAGTELKLAAERDWALRILDEPATVRPTT